MIKVQLIEIKHFHNNKYQIQNLIVILKYHLLPQTTNTMYRLLLAQILLLLFNSIYAQKILNGIAKIEVFESNGNLLNTGAGIICGNSDSEVFIVTAFHVVEDGDNILVTFYNRQWEQFSAKLYPQFNPDLDYSVLTVKAPVKKIKSTKYRQPYFEKLKPGNNIQVIGHPLGEEWTLNSQNVISNPKFSTFEISFSNIGIAPGFSGGALLTKKKDQLAGLIVNVDTHNSIAVRIDQVKRDLDSWGIPYDNILPYKPPRRPSFFFFTTTTLLAGGAAAYLEFLRVDPQYQIYSDNLFDSDDPYTAYEGSRENYLNEILQLRQYALYTAAGAGVSAVLALLTSKRKVKQKDVGFGLLLDPFDSSIAGANIGLKLNF